MNKKILSTGVLLFLAAGLSAQTQIGSDILGKMPYDQSGINVALSADGSTVAIGAHTSSDHAYFAGQGRIFKNVSGHWSQIGQDLNGEDQDLFGRAAAISSDGRIVAFGAPFDDSTYPDTGEVRVYENVSGNWVQLVEINGTVQEENLGFSVALSDDGSIMASGAPYNDTSMNESGQVKIYKNVSGVWTQMGPLIDGGEYEKDHFGYSVSLSSDGLTLAVGAPQNTQNQVNPCFVKVYRYVGGDWYQIGNTVTGTNFNNRFGESVSLSDDGSILAVGAPGGGYARIYKYMEDTTTWVQIGGDLVGNSPGGKFGSSVSLSADGTTVGIGAPSANSTSIFKNELGHYWINKIVLVSSASDYSGASVSLSSHGSVVAIGAPSDTQIGNLSGKTAVYDLSAILSSDQFVMSGTSVYPNPVKNEFYIQLTESLNLEQVNIYSTLGQLIKSEKTNRIDVSSLQAGCYFVQIVTDKGKATHKILVD